MWYLPTKITMSTMSEKKEIQYIRKKRVFSKTGINVIFRWKLIKNIHIYESQVKSPLFI